MKTRRIFASTILTLVAATGLVYGSTAIRLSFEDLIQRSDRIVVAHQLSATSAWGPNKRLIFTTSRFMVDENLAGDGAAEFSIVQPGGSVGRLAQITHGYPSFKPGEKVLIFLHKVAMKEGQEALRVTALSQGVFKISQEQEGQFLVQGLEGLSFPNDDGRAIRLERSKALEIIQRVWTRSDAP